MNPKIRTHRDLIVYQRAMSAAMEIWNLSRQFPADERFSLTDQFRRASRSVCANLAEAWRKRRYKGAFIAKLSDAEGEAAESQVWIEFAVKCKYLPRDKAAALYRAYNAILRTLVGMINHPETWVIGAKSE